MASTDCRNSVARSVAGTDARRPLRARCRRGSGTHPVGRTFYGLSTVICTPGSLDQEVGLALGAQAGQRRITAMLREAGFSRVRLATQTPFNLVLEARP